MGNTLKSLGCIKNRQRRVAGGRQHMWTKSQKTRKIDSNVLKESDLMSTSKDVSGHSFIEF